MKRRILASGALVAVALAAANLSAQPAKADHVVSSDLAQASGTTARGDTFVVSVEGDGYGPPTPFWGYSYSGEVQWAAGGSCRFAGQSWREEGRYERLGDLTASFSTSECGGIDLVWTTKQLERPTVSVWEDSCWNCGWGSYVLRVYYHVANQHEASVVGMVAGSPAQAGISSGAATLSTYLSGSI